jgi:hypothetical protein
MELDLEIQEVTISSDGQIRLSYILHLETSEFSGPVAGGQSAVTDPKILSLAEAFVASAKVSALKDLGLQPQSREESLNYSDEEDPL